MINIRNIAVASSLIVACIAIPAMAQEYQSPLAKYDVRWNDKKYAPCNSAKNATYMTPAEREVIHMLNLVRTDPKLYSETVLTRKTELSELIDTSSETYYKSLVSELINQDPLPILLPDSLCYVSAYWHAKSSGEKDYTGHERQTDIAKKAKHFEGEICEYSSDDPFEIVLQLLVDEEVPSLGHRKVILSNYHYAGAAIATHKTYRFAAVIDFYH